MRSYGETVVSKVIVLDSTGQHVRILEGDARGGRLVVQRMTTVALPQGPDTPNDVLQGLIRDALVHDAKSGALTIGLIGRTNAVLRDLRVPDAPPDELPGIVQFQAMRELSFPIEQASIDYEVVGLPEADGQRRVLLAALQQDVVERCRAAVSAAGLTLSRLGLRPYATWRAYRQLAVMPEGGVLVVSLAGDFVELTVARGNTVLFSRATMLKASADSKTAADVTALLVAEVRRTLAAFANQVPGVAVDRVALAAGPDQHQAASDALAHALGIAVDRFDPFQAVELAGNRVHDPAAFVAAIGAALAASEPWPIDFLNPKKPVVPRDRRKPIALAVAAAVVLMIAGSYTLAQLKLATGRKTLASLLDRQTKLKKSVTEGNEVIRKSQEIERFLNSGIDCLGELKRLSERHPDTREMYTSSVTFSHDASANGSTKIALDGFAKGSNVLEKLHENLNEDEHYSAQPDIGPTTTQNTRSGEYKTSVRSRITVKAEKPEGAETDATPVSDGAAAGRAAASSRDANLLQVGKKSGDANTKPAVNKK